VIYLAETKDARNARAEYLISTVILVRLRRRMTVPPPRLENSIRRWLTRASASMERFVTFMTRTKNHAK
jgi:hypothetical protein